jgi:hypothetical protein
MHTKDSDMIWQAFMQVRLGLPIDRSRNHEIKIKDFPDIQVGNWKDWQPKEAIKGEDIQSNLTLDVGELGQFTASSDRNRDDNIPLRLSDSTT